MLIKADTWDELIEAVAAHESSGWVRYRHWRESDGTRVMQLVRADPLKPQDHPAISAAAVELRKLGVSYETAKPILRRVFNAGKGAGQ